MEPRGPGGREKYLRKWAIFGLGILKRATQMMAARMFPLLKDGQETPEEVMRNARRRRRET